jgi:hypothetical protein
LIRAAQPRQSHGFAAAKHLTRLMFGCNNARQGAV